MQRALGNDADLAQVDFAGKFSPQTIAEKSQRGDRKRRKNGEMYTDALRAFSGVYLKRG